MLINAFQPMIIGTPLSVTASNQAVTIAYDTKQLTSYLLTNIGTQTIFFLFGATAATVNSIPILANTQVTFTGPANAAIQAIAAATGSTLYVAAGEGV